jgi:cellulose synthase operon protein C
MGAKTARRLVILIVTIFVIGLLIFLTQRYQVTRMDRSVLARAAQAEKDGNFEEAERLYQQHLDITPDDQDVQLKYADLLLKGVKNVNRQAQALQLYEQIVSRSPGRADIRDIRRRLAELQVELATLRADSESYRQGRQHLEILLKTEQTDGKLHFLLGRCLEALGENSRAEAAYQEAITNNAPQRLEAYQRRASLLRSQLNKPEQADKVIEKMVQSNPGNPRVYLERGRYHRRYAKTLADLKAVTDDLQEALKQSTNDPEIYVELAGVAQAKGNNQEARRVLENGLKVLPRDPSLHEALAMVDYRSGLTDAAITRLRKSVQLLPDEGRLHLALADILAEKGDRVELRAEIDELRRLNYVPVLVEFLEAYQQANSRDWQKARQTLIRLQAPLDSNPILKARLNNLLARCYSHLGDRDRQRDAQQRALAASPQDIPARLGLALSMVSRGEVEQAIEELRKMAALVPQARSLLVRLLIARNQQQSPSQRNWTELTELIQEAKGFAPDSSERVLLQVDLLLAQDKTTEAESLLGEARSRSPRDLELMLKSAEVLRRQRKYLEAGMLLDQAHKIGDTINLRLERAQLLVAQGGAGLSGALVALAANDGAFLVDDRRRLLESLVENIIRLNDLPAAKKLLLQVVDLDRNDLGPRLRLLDLAFLAKSRDDIKSQIEDIKKIDGGDGPTGRFQEIRFELWQAEQPGTNEDEKKALRSSARLKINDLISRRPDWPQIPLALAQLDEQELAQPDLDDSTRKRKFDEAANHYLRAIELGERRLEIIRRAADRLYDAGRPTEVTQLWNQLPTATLLGSSLQQQVTAEAVRKGDYDRALELARKAVAANPDDFRERLWLVQVLLASQQRPDRLAEAEAELRSAVNAVRTDPDRWMTLVQFLAQTKQMEKAEQTVRDAELALKDKWPIGLARCCEALGQVYKLLGQDAQKTKIWLDTATQWYKTAQNAKPDDPAATHQLVEYLLRSGQRKDVELQLTSILEKNQVNGPKSTDEVAWARRTLALCLLMNDDDYRQSRKALELLEPVVKVVEGHGAADRTALKPDDLRVLARVYHAQGTQAYQEKARKILEDLADAQAIIPEDRFLLARMYNNDGQWTKAHEQYRVLVAQTENSRELDVVTRRPDYLAQFISDLLTHYESGHDHQEELSEAQELIEKLKLEKSDTWAQVALEARIYKAQNQVDKAVQLIQTTAGRANLPDVMQVALAKLAEDLGQSDLAEQLLRQLIGRSERVQNRLALAKYIGRRGRAKEALDECERLWKGPTNPDELVQSTLDALFSSGGQRDPAQLNRAAGWIQEGLEKKPKSSILIIALANLREHQGRFQEAKALYRRDIDQGEGDVVALNNLAFLLTLMNEKGNGALDLINRAIARRGPGAELLDTRGVVYMMAGDSRRAIEDMERATSLDPIGPKYFHLAQAYLRAGDKTAAAESLAKAQVKGLKPDNIHPLEVTAYKQLLTELGVKSE